MNYLLPQTLQASTFTKLGVEQGLPQSGVRDIVQDKEGFIWVATEAGLSRYDGYKFKQYFVRSSNSALINGRINKLHIDQQKTLWLTTTQGIYRYDEQIDQLVALKIPSDYQIEIENHSIMDIQSSKEALWIITEEALYKYNFNSQKTIKVNFDLSKQIPRRLEYNLNTQSLWLIAVHASYLIDQKENTLIIVTHNKTSEPVIFNTAYYLSNGDLKFYANGYIWCPDYLNHEASVFICGNASQIKVFDDNQFTSIKQQANGKNWLGIGSKGLFQMDAELNIQQHFFHSASNQDSLSNNDIVSISFDSQQNIWLGLLGGGVHKMSKSAQEFSRFNTKKNPSLSLSHNHVRSFYKTDNNGLWIGTFNGLNYLDKKTKHIKHYFLNNSQNSLHFGNFIKDIVKFDENHLMITVATPYQNTAFWKFNTESLIWSPIPVPPELQSSSGFDLLRIDNKIWVAMIHKGLFYYDIIKKSWLRPAWLNKKQSPINIQQLYLDSKNNLWIASMQKGAFKYNFDTHKLQIFKQDITRKKEHGNLNGNWVKSFLEDHEGNIWIATTNGLNKYVTKSDRIEYFLLNNSNNDREDTVYGLLQDSKKFIWASTNHGLVRFNPSDIEDVNQFSVHFKRPKDIRYFHKQDGLQGEEFNTGAFIKYKNESDEEQFYFGGTQGFISFNPLAFNQDYLEKPPILTSLSFFNHPIRVGEKVKGFQLNKPLHLLNKLVLSYQHTLFSISFSSLNYNNNQIKYAYRMKGLYDEWIETDDLSRKATFSGLPSGKYNFQVKVKNINGFWNNTKIDLPIVITPPWWKNNLAYFIYLSIIITLPYFIFRQRNIVNKKRAFDLKQQVELRTQQLKDALRQKEEIFTNISHEFRTPLTLMIGPAEQLNNEKQNEQVQAIGKRIKRNGEHLLRLINQILGIAQIDLEKADNHISTRINISPLLISITERFSSYAESKNIYFSYKISDNLFVQAELQDIEQIVSNILSNAFKYTNSKGIIHLSCSLNSNGKITCLIKDSGQGILKSELPFIFERFYKASNNNEEIQSSGIGLSLVKALLNKSKGEIVVESKVNKGSVFELKWPAITPEDTEIQSIKPATDLVNTTYTEQEIAILENPFFKTSDSNYLVVNSSTVPLKQNKSKHKTTVLFIEDHADLREYLSSRLSKEYLCITASNGVKGVELALKHLPHIIISDIMMPKLDGYGVCEQLKSDHRTSHIPILLLTAKADQSSRLKGLIHEANAYLSKPFDYSELCLNIKNLLSDRVRLKKQFCLSLDNDQWNTENLPDEDQSFLKCLEQFMQEFFSDSQFQSADLAEKLNMSNRQLQRKFKAVAGITPTHYIRQWRLNKSRRLLLNGNAIGNIALECGFNSQAHFGKCFKEQFDMTASEYVDLHNSSNTATT